MTTNNPSRWSGCTAQTSAEARGNPQLRPGLSHPALSVALVTMLASCGTIMNPGPFFVPVNTQPDGATVVYRGAQVGKTPCQIAMEPDDLQLQVRLPGFEPATVQVRHSTNLWMFGNILFGGVIGLIIDVATFSTTVVDTDPVEIVLVPLSAP